MITEKPERMFEHEAAPADASSDNRSTHDERLNRILEVATGVSYVDTAASTPLAELPLVTPEGGPSTSEEIAY